MWSMVHRLLLYIAFIEQSFQASRIALEPLHKEMLKNEWVSTVKEFIINV